MLSLFFSHHFSPLETISTSLWASVHHHFLYCLFSAMSAVSSCVHVFPDVVDPSPPPFFSSQVRSCPSFFLRGAITVPSFQLFISYQDVVCSERLACFHTLHWTVLTSALVPADCPRFRLGVWYACSTEASTWSPMLLRTPSLPVVS